MTLRISCVEGLVLAWGGFLSGGGGWEGEGGVRVGVTAVAWIIDLPPPDPG